jgi:hypothetical protein
MVDAVLADLTRKVASSSQDEVCFGGGLSLRVITALTMLLLAGTGLSYASGDGDLPQQLNGSLEQNDSGGQSLGVADTPRLILTMPELALSPPAPRLFAAPIEGHSGFKWKAATVDSFRFLMLQTAARLAFQSKTRRALAGPFFKDYIDVLRTPPSGFMDGDSWITNFVGHPIQGATSYHLARVNGASRMQAFYWGLAYSTQFELGLVGEGTVGNVPISPVDLVVTPSAGYLLGVTEEWLMSKFEKLDHPAGRVVRRLLLGRLLARVCSGK